MCGLVCSADRLGMPSVMSINANWLMHDASQPRTDHSAAAAFTLGIILVLDAQYVNSTTCQQDDSNPTSWTDLLRRNVGVPPLVLLVHQP